MVVINYLVNCLFIKPRSTTGKNSRLWGIVGIHSTLRRNVYLFNVGRRKVSAQGRGSVLYSMMELYSHSDTVLCGSNCIVMYFTGKEYDVATYTDTDETIKAVPIVQADTAYNNPETGDTTILILSKAIWMGETMDHILLSPNQLCAYGMTVQCTLFHNDHFL